MDQLELRGPMVPLRVCDNVTIYVESLEGEEQVSMGEWMDFIGPIEPVVNSIKKLITDIKPQKARVEFGIQLGLESGKITSCIVKGSTDANLKLVLEWSADTQES